MALFGVLVKKTTHSFFPFFHFPFFPSYTDRLVSSGVHFLHLAKVLRDSVF
jgi:hypothetical protein